jgi:hypothetical protein
MAATTTPQALSATSKARAILVQRHQDEYAVILGDEREKIGLARVPGGPSKARMEQQIAKRQEQLEKLLETYNQTYGN